MVGNSAAKPHRGRGRPPKVKRGGRKPNASDTAITQAGTSDGLLPTLAAPTPEQDSSEIIRSISEDADSDSPVTSATGSKRTSPETDDYIPPAKRSRNKPSLLSHLTTSNDSGSPAPSIDRKARPIILPARRSTRQATVHSTQISEGTLRPPGPPNLEAALSIALRNLESEMWRYLWAYQKKHPNGPLPTPAAVKEACASVRIAATAVDRADRELEDAVDEIMLSNAKKKGRGGSRPSKGIGRFDVGMNNEGGGPDATKSPRPGTAFPSDDGGSAGTDQAALFNAGPSQISGG